MLSRIVSCSAQPDPTAGRRGVAPRRVTLARLQAVAGDRRRRPTCRGIRLWVLLPWLGLAGACGQGPLPPAGDRLATGTWGGDNAGLIVNDTIAHAHVGCTYGNFPAPVALDQEGRFNVSGSYLLRAYPIPIGPPLPAQFAGLVTGRRLTFTVAVNDTVEKKLVALGPVTVTLGTEPRLGPCPICRVPRALRAPPRAPGGPGAAVTHAKSAP